MLSLHGFKLFLRIIEALSSPQTETQALLTATTMRQHRTSSNRPAQRRVSLVVDFSVFSNDNEGDGERESEDAANVEPRRMTENQWQWLDR